MYYFDSKIRYSEVDSNRKLTILALLDYFQNCSAFHSEQEGLGIDYLNEIHSAWILSTWQVCINRLPEFLEEVQIKTMPYEIRGFYGQRNFMMDTKDGERLAYANTLWVHLDTNTGRPSRATDAELHVFAKDEPLDMDYCERKLAVPKEYEEKEAIRVPGFFIDTNQHMNNSRYVMVAMEYLPEDYEIRELRVEYKKAALLGDIIIPRVTMLEDKMVVNLVGEDGRTYAIVHFLPRNK